MNREHPILEKSFSKVTTMQGFQPPLKELTCKIGMLPMNLRKVRRLMKKEEGTSPNNKTQNQRNKKECHIDSLTTNNVAILCFTSTKLRKKGLLATKDEVDDVIQDARLEVQKFIKGKGKINNPEAFIRTIILRIIEKRKDKWEKKYSKDTTLSEDYNEPDSKNSNSPEEYVQSIEFFEFIDKYLSKIEYSILIYHYVYYYCYEQIANKLNDLGLKNGKGGLFTAVGIRKLAKRAREKLKKRLGG